MSFKVGPLSSLSKVRFYSLLHEIVIMFVLSVSETSCSPKWCFFGLYPVILSCSCLLYMLVTAADMDPVYWKKITKLLFFILLLSLFSSLLIFTIWFVLPFHCPCTLTMSKRNLLWKYMWIFGFFRQIKTLEHKIYTRIIYWQCSLKAILFF